MQVVVVWLAHLLRVGASRARKRTEAKILTQFLMLFVIDITMKVAQHQKLKGKHIKRFKLCTSYLV